MTLPPKTVQVALLLAGLAATLWRFEPWAQPSTPSNAAVSESLARGSASEAPPLMNPEPASKAQSARILANLRPAPGGDPRVDLDVLAHPASEHAARDARQHELFAAVSVALEARDFARARALISEHERSFAADGWHDQRRGFELVLGCLERRDERAEFTSDAERYLKEARISPLRRSVRRVCLEGRAFRRRA